MSDALFDYRSQVHDEVTFRRFLSALAAEYASGKTDDWQNVSIDQFFECATAWASASEDGLQFYDLPDNPWRRCADIIYMGKIYE